MTSATSYHPRSAAAIALAPLDSISSSLDTLVQTIQTSTTFTQLPTITKDITTADNDLTSALNLLKQHQANYARILHLREEATQLETDIKDTIRRARQLRSEITSIHPSIDDDTIYDDADEDDTPLEVNYAQLLQFAARIGKHNSLAKQEAEQEGTRLKLAAIEARKKADEASSAAVRDSNAQTNAAEENHPDITAHQSGELSAIADAFEASSRLPFPSPELLRKGALGRLEILREADPGDPEGAVDREVERMVRETETVATASAAIPSRSVTGDSVAMREAQQQASGARVAVATAGAAAQSQAQRQPQAQQQQQQQQLPPKPKKKVDLDFPGADSDDEDDDD